MNKNETAREDAAMIPYYVHEGEINRLERINRRFFALLLIVFLALIGTNAGWIVHESLYEDVVVTQDIDTGEGSAVLSGTGDVYYGENKTDSENPPKESAERNSPV